VDDEVRARVAELYGRGARTEDVLEFLRGAGCGVIDCIKTVARYEGLTLRDAKRKVHFSRAWSDMRATHDALHDVAEEALCRLAEEGRGPP
jgi:hypothetical protein